MSVLLLDRFASFVSLLASCVFLSLSFASLRFVSSWPCWQVRQIVMCCCLCPCISFVSLRFALFCFVLLCLLLFCCLSFCVLFVSVLSFVSVFSLFSGEGFRFYGFGLRHQSRTASYGMFVLVPWCRRSLRFVSLAFRLCFSCLLLLIVDLQFYSFVYEVVLDGLEQVCVCVRVCVRARCDGPDGLAYFFLALLPQSR